MFIIFFLFLFLFLGWFIKKKLSKRRVNRPIGKKSKTDFFEKIGLFFSKKKKEDKFSYESFDQDSLNDKEHRY